MLRGVYPDRCEPKQCHPERSEGEGLSMSGVDLAGAEDLSHAFEPCLSEQESVA
jgi:hypothetical protein